jgi:hypothetical protein
VSPDIYSQCRTVATRNYRPRRAAAPPAHTAPTLDPSTKNACP